MTGQPDENQLRTEGSCYVIMDFHFNGETADFFNGSLREDDETTTELAVYITEKSGKFLDQLDEMDDFLLSCKTMPVGTYDNIHYLVSEFSKTKPQILIAIVCDAIQGNPSHARYYWNGLYQTMPIKHPAPPLQPDKDNWTRVTLHNTTGDV